MLFLPNEPSYRHRVEALAEILDLATGGSAVPCPSTDVTITVEFNALILSASVDGAANTATVSTDGNSVVFDVDDLEDNATGFYVLLDHCGETAGTEIVSSVSYTDADENSPDLTVLSGTVPQCDGEFGASCLPSRMGLCTAGNSWCRLAGSGPGSVDLTRRTRHVPVMHV